MASTCLPKYTKLPDKMPKIEKGNEATDKVELNKTQKPAAGGPIAIGKEGNKIETLAVRNVSKDDVIAKKTGQRIMKDNAYRIGIDTEGVDLDFFTIMRKDTTNFTSFH
uniref:Polyprotein n=1 Tax=Ascaris lumbricoides TaxID=6252 RepID=A0A0M3ISB9_ASCLU